MVLKTISPGLWGTGISDTIFYVLDSFVFYLFIYLFTGFRCCYCQSMNPARKRRPPAPRIPHTVSPIQQSATGTGQRIVGRNTEEGKQENLGWCWFVRY